MTHTPSSVPIYVTDDLSFAAYLRMYGFQEVSANRLGKTFKIVFIRHPMIGELRKQWRDSEAAAFDREVRDLKRKLFSVQPLEGFGEYRPKPSL